MKILKYTIEDGIISQMCGIKYPKWYFITYVKMDCCLKLSFCFPLLCWTKMFIEPRLRREYGYQLTISHDAPWTCLMSYTTSCQVHIHKSFLTMWDHHRKQTWELNTKHNLSVLTFSWWFPMFWEKAINHLPWHKFHCHFLNFLNICSFISWWNMYYGDEIHNRTSDHIAILWLMSSFLK